MLSEVERSCSRASCPWPSSIIIRRGQRRVKSLCQIIAACGEDNRQWWNMGPDGDIRIVLELLGHTTHLSNRRPQHRRNERPNHHRNGHPNHHRNKNPNHRRNGNPHHQSNRRPNHNGKLRGAEQEDLEDSLGKFFFFFAYTIEVM